MHCFILIIIPYTPCCKSLKSIHWIWSASMHVVTHCKQNCVYLQCSQ